MVPAAVAPGLMSPLRSIAVVGGSLAAVSTVRALRAQGFAGLVTVLADETHAPYDRPPLSKDFLAGRSDDADLALLAEGEYATADWRHGVRAVSLHPTTTELALDDGTTLAADGIVLATGARPRLPWPAVPAGVHVLRTLDDARALRADLHPGARLVVVGAGFIGSEVASTARGAGLDVTIVEAAAEPLVAQLGTVLGAAVAGLHAEHGARLVTGAPVTGFLVGGRVEGVCLADGRTVAADVVLVGAGVLPNVEWLAGSGLGDIDGGVRCDAYGNTSRPGIVAVGDCAQWWDPEQARHRRVEHWHTARERAATAAASLLSGGTARLESRPAYVWSDQYGRRLQLAGDPHLADTVGIEEGVLGGPEYLAVYRRDGEPVAVFASGLSRSFMRWRKQLAATQAADQAAAQAADQAAAQAATCVAAPLAGTSA